MAKTTWTNGDVGGSQTLTPSDHLHETHINELRTAINPLEDLSHYGDIRNAGDFASIQAAIDDLPTTGGKVIVPPGTHILTTTLSIPKNVWVCGSGMTNTILYLADNTTLPNSSGQYAFIYMNDTGTVTHYGIISDLTVNGNKANQSQGGQQGIFGIYSDYVRIYRVKIIDVAYRSIYLSATSIFIIKDCQIFNTGDRAIEIEGCGHGLILDNYISYPGSHGIQIDNSPFCIVRGNRIEHAGNFSIGVDAHSNQTLIEGNSIYFSEDEGVQVTDSQYCKVVSNIIDTVISDFGISVESRGTSDCSHTTIVNNFVAGANNNGIALLGTRWAICTNNTVYNCLVGGAGGAIFTNDTTVKNIISNNMIIDDRGTKLHSHGVLEDTGGDYNVIVGNCIQGYLTAGVATVGGNTINQHNVAVAS